MKSIIVAFSLLLAALNLRGAEDNSVLLAPIEASRVGAYDWGVVILSDPIPTGGSSADRGSLKINLDLVKFFQEGYAIYSITKIDKKESGTPALLLVLVRPKK